MRKDLYKFAERQPEGVHAPAYWALHRSNQQIVGKIFHNNHRKVSPLSTHPLRAVGNEILKDSSTPTTLFVKY